MTANTLIFLSGAPAMLGLIVGRCGQYAQLMWGWTATQAFHRILDACIVTAATMQLGGMVWTLI